MRKIEKIHRLSLWVNISSILLGAVISLILVFTPFKNLIFSFILGALMGLVAFTIMLNNAKSLVKQSMIIKEGQKPVNYFPLYFAIKLIFILVVCAVVAYSQYVLEKEGYNLVMLVCGYLSTRVAVIGTALFLREKVI